MNTSVNASLPVLVWFHGRSYLHFSNLYYFLIWIWGETGGGFASGSTHPYLPDLLITSSAKPLIFVSFEYRLGQFGFLGQFITLVSVRIQSHRSFKVEARYVMMELSTLVFLIRYSTRLSTYKRRFY